MIDGLTPDPASHVTKLNVEPNSGLVIAAKKRIQFNVLVKRIRGQVSYFTGIQVVNYLRTIVFKSPFPQFAQAFFFFFFFYKTFFYIRGSITITVQSSLLIKKLPQYIFRGIKDEMVLPLFWTEESYEVPAEIALYVDLLFSRDRGSSMTSPLNNE